MAQVVVVLALQVTEQVRLEQLLVMVDLAVVEQVRVLLKAQVAQEYFTFSTRRLL
jgi:hypothetical protein